MSNSEDFIIENGEITKYLGCGGNVVIPEGVKEFYGFTEIAEGVKITCITLPESIEFLFPHFGYGPNMKYLTELTINGPSELENGTFTDCKNLKTVHIGKNVKHIEKNAFKGCKNLEKVYFDVPEGQIKVDCFAFPETASLFYTGTDAPQKSKAESDIGITLAAAKKYMKLKKEKDGYKIDIADTGRIHLVLFDDGGFGEFNRNVTDHVINIPQAIGGIPVTHIAARMIPGDAIVHCSPTLFTKLSRQTKSTTTIAWLRNPQQFSDKEAVKIKDFLNRYTADVIDAISEQEIPSFYDRLFQNAKVTKADIEILINKPFQSTETKALLLEKSEELANESPSTLDAPKITVAELKKLWTLHKLCCADKPNTEFYSITHYKGREEVVTIPAKIGKYPVRMLEGDIFKEGCPVKKLIIEYNPELKLDCDLKHAVGLADPNGFIIVEHNGNYILTNYIGNQKTICVPDYVTDISFYAFREVQRAEKIMIPEGVRSVFLELSNICDTPCDVCLPESVSDIVLYTPNRNSRFKVHVIAGSQSEIYCKKHKIRFEAE